MKSKLFIFTFFILHFTFYIQLFAQNTWIHTYDPFYADSYSVEDVVVCQDGGYAINGYYEIYDPPFYDEKWGFLIKTDYDGNLLWAKIDTVSFMSENESLAFIETDDGGFLSAGSSPWGSYLIKRDSIGNRLWSMFNDFHVESMSKTDDGYIILGGVTTDNGYPGIRKITQEAEILLTKDFYLSGSGIGRINSIIQTSDGGFASTGYTSGNGFDFFVLKTDSNGDSLWCEIYDGYGEWDEARIVMEDNESNLIISGYLEVSVSVHYGFLLKLTDQGEQIYMLTDNNSNSYYGCNCIVEDIIEEKIVCYGRDEDGPALNAFSYEGDSLWVSSMTGWGAAGDRCLQLIDEGFILCGRNWQYDISLTKTDNNGQVTAVNDEIIYSQDYKLSNYPNPFNPSTLIQFTLPDDVENPVVEIFNIKGQMIEKIPISNMQLSIDWFADKNASGLYLYRINSENYISETKKMTLIK